MANTFAPDADGIIRQVRTDLHPAGEGMTMLTFQSKTIQVGARTKTVQIMTGRDFLPMPQNIEVAYPKNWATKNGFMGDLSGQDWLGTVGNTLAGFAEGGARTLKGAVSIAVPDELATETSYQTQMTINDRKKLIFEGIDHRQFQFVLLFQPKNGGEQADIHEWIRRIKIDSAPVLTAGDTAFQYPDYFELQWEKLQNLFTTGPLALTNISVNYTPEGMWTEHQGDMKPTATRVTLSFSEIDLPTREEIQGGW